MIAQVAGEEGVSAQRGGRPFDPARRGTEAGAGHRPAPPGARIFRLGGYMVPRADLRPQSMTTSRAWTGIGRTPMTKARAGPMTRAIGMKPHRFRIGKQAMATPKVIASRRMRRAGQGRCGRRRGSGAEGAVVLVPAAEIEELLGALRHRDPGAGEVGQQVLALVQQAEPVLDAP